MDSFEINNSMEEITNYVIDSSKKADEKADPPVKPEVVLNDDSTIDIIFNDERKLSEFLPDKLKIKDTPDFNKPILYKVISEDGEIQNLEVRINHEWLKKGGSAQVAIFAHEIGHALAIEEEIKRNKELKKLFEEHPSFDAIDDNVKAYMTYCFLKRASGKLDNEIQAWNYGKIVATLLGINDTQYEDIMRPQIEGMYYAVYLPTYDFIKDLYRGDITSLNKDITYPLYDSSQQKEILVTAEELLSAFNKLDDDKYKRNIKETGNFKS